ncbi:MULTISPECIES: hypothetical protein [Novacetimonas]|uniref:Uncharacterized protein n=1 Tax=Novacetimonas pomaceti TaxID=2021998 RepID=A0A318QT05_9PROT|nr:MULTISPECIES: hypothetical protein [Novacetimonas]MBV1834079.1 hypothetical protein [Novacetimonas pomaceti]PYD75853.1 hypothetical protein CFR71_07275 [Novacetimonas pomaceti]
MSTNFRRGSEPPPLADKSLKPPFSTPLERKHAMLTTAMVILFLAGIALGCLFSPHIPLPKL